MGKNDFYIVIVILVSLIFVSYLFISKREDFLVSCKKKNYKNSNHYVSINGAKTVRFKRGIEYANRVPVNFVKRRNCKNYREPNLIPEGRNKYFSVEDGVWKQCPKNFYSTEQDIRNGIVQCRKKTPKPTSAGDQGAQGDILNLKVSNKEEISKQILNGNNNYMVTIPDSVTKIEDNAFLECTNLVSVIIPDSVTSIGQNAFASCIGLRSLSLPGTLENIDTSAFDGSENITDVLIREMLSKISNFNIYLEAFSTQLNNKNNIFIFISEQAFENLELINAYVMNQMGEASEKQLDLIHANQLSAINAHHDEFGAAGYGDIIMGGLGRGVGSLESQGDLPPGYIRHEFRV